MSRRWSRTIYVGNLPGDIREREVEDLFYKYGRIVDIDLKVPPRPPGYAFVEFEDPRDAEEACVGRDDYNFDGHRLRVEPAHGGRGSGGPSPEASSSVPVSESLDGQKEIISKLDQLLAGQKAHEEYMDKMWQKLYKIEKQQKSLMDEQNKMRFGMNAYVEKFKTMEINVIRKTKGVNNSLLSISEDTKEMRRSLGLSSSSPISSILFKTSDDKGGEKGKSQASQRGEKSKKKASAEEETSPSGRSRSSRSAKSA